MIIDALAAVGSMSSSTGTPDFLPPAQAIGVGSNSLAGNAVQIGPAKGADFGNWFAHELNQLNGQLQQVDSQVQSLALGGSQNLHQLMINMEQAKLSFQLMAQVRNRLLEAYQEVMRMQV
ncbi:MAG: flagellar hook-basal body complex protein FliE [Pseudomonadota bacterium]|jgi:flagellar hook-basal body complex protein FliE